MPRFSREIELYRQYEIDTLCDLGAELTEMSEQLNAAVSGQHN